MTKGVWFKRLVELPKPQENLPCLKTVARHLGYLATNETLLTIREGLLGQPEGGTHFQIDILTSHFRYVILPIRIHFKDVSEPYMLFRHMKGRHTSKKCSANIPF